MTSKCIDAENNEMVVPHPASSSRHHHVPSLQQQDLPVLEL